MAIRQIFKNDAECLYKKCRPVERFDKKLSDLIDDMADTMYEADGVGLAAPQVGILRRVFVIDCGDGLVEMVNPVNRGAWRAACHSPASRATSCVPTT